jgi:uncharacterized membrane protein YcaP (DUF421 family)
LIKPRPVFLMDEGNVLDDALRHERVTRGEFLAALRGGGRVSIELIRNSSILRCF